MFLFLAWPAAKASLCHLYPSHRCSSGRISPSSARFPLGPLLLYAGGGRHASGGMTRSVGNWILASGPQGPRWWAKRFPDWGVKDASYSRAIPLGAGIRRSSVSPVDSLGRARGRSSPICRRVRHGPGRVPAHPTPIRPAGRSSPTPAPIPYGEAQDQRGPTSGLHSPGAANPPSFFSRSVQNRLVEAGAEAGA